VLLSPIAWIHHYVWFVPVLGALVADGRDRLRVVGAAMIAFVLALRLPWWGWSLLDEGPLGATIGVLLHNAYVLLALGLLLFFPVLDPQRSGDQLTARATPRSLRPRSQAW
jgi:alpha-1,2-mannosyltransferase